MLVCFALGLMAKPMLVTLPAVLLLLDVWPLGRVSLAFREQQSVWLRGAVPAPIAYASLSRSAARNLRRSAGPFWAARYTRAMSSSSYTWATRFRKPAAALRCAARSSSMTPAPRSRSNASP